MPTLSFLNHVAIPQGSLGVSLIGSIMHDGASKNFITLLSLGMNTLHFVNHSNVDAGSSYLLVLFMCTCRSPFFQNFIYLNLYGRRMRKN